MPDTKPPEKTKIESITIKWQAYCLKGIFIGWHQVEYSVQVFSIKALLD
jgi:hypothetical protein